MQAIAECRHHARRNSTIAGITLQDCGTALVSSRVSAARSPEKNLKRPLAAE
jgi:hypothetical protein